MDAPTVKMILPTGKWIKNAEKTRPAAFTLIELVLVMAMLLIVLAVAAPSLSRFFRGRTLDSEARRFVSLTRYGQSRAVSEGVPMLLWIDPKQSAYGLEEETGYTAVDGKAVDFAIGKDLIVEVADLPSQAATAQVGRAAQSNPNKPTIRFLPDGFISETSPRSVLIRENAGETIWITQSRNRLNYEIQAHASSGSLR